MANFYTDNKALKFHLENPKLERIVKIKENNFDNKDDSGYAPINYADALDNFDKVLEVCGEVCGDIIDPNAEAVDADGPTLVDNRVHYAKGTVENIAALNQAGLSGMTLPREYGGLNFPATVYNAAIEMVARADASLMNIFGLQDIGETIKEFGTDEQLKEFLPGFATGEYDGAMILTEPDAGSDLQAVDLKAHLDEETGEWKLNGVKRFITNGNAKISLVLARSEDGSKGGRGLSMFIYVRDETVNIRRIENKMGIHGSPTCEMVFKDSPGLLVGKQRFGLIKYVMALMNSARLGVSAQAIGISEAAYREALKYAKDRAQFGKIINKFPAVYELLTNMKARTEAGRTLLYETARFVDLYKEYDEISKERKLDSDEKTEMKKYQKRADFFTPLLKGLTSEYANSITYDAIQIHGGTGFMKDFPVERLYRDARITSIYEGTTQLQVVAAIRGVTSGLYGEMMDEYHAEELSSDFDSLKNTLKSMTEEYKEVAAFVSGFTIVAIIFPPNAGLIWKSRSL